MLRNHSIIKDACTSYSLNKNVITSCRYIHNVKEISNRLQDDDSTLHFNSDRNAFIKNVLMKKETKVNIDPKKIVIDFSSPNVAKPFHVGHLRSTIIGNFIANIHKHFQNKVTKINYLGDWGTQFGILQYGLESNKIDVNALEKNPINVLYNIYVESTKLSATDENVQIAARKHFADIEQGKASLDNWKKIREFTVQELENTYKRLGITFDDYHWESDYNGKAIQHVIKLLETKNIMLTDETGKKYTKVKDRKISLLRSDNSTLYMARDIAALLDKYERYKYDKMLFVVDNAQTDHFMALFDIVKRIDEECVKGCEHIKFGRIKGMSTRRGNVIFLSDILDEAKHKMYHKQKQSKNTRTSAMNEETCDILGTTAVLINDLKQKRLKDYEFDWDRALQSEGDSGIKLQYLHCRLWNLEKNCGVKVPSDCHPEYLKEDIVNVVVSELAVFDDALKRAYEENEACILVNYLFRLSRHVNRMFKELKVKNVDLDLASQRILVFNSARLVLKCGLEILGIKPLHEM
ncbi:probable arginine--tRNA ligase, mitochondrial isoform X2 [Epargyreus clarus]